MLPAVRLGHPRRRVVARDPLFIREKSPDMRTSRTNRMSLAYRLLYAVGFTPWEQLAALPALTSRSQRC